MADQSELNHPLAAAAAPNQNSSLNPDDADADADLSRPSRAMQFRVQRRSQVSTAIPALLLIALGIALLLKPRELTYPLEIGAAVTVLGISLVMRFLLNTRRERGLFFVGILILLWLGFVVWIVYGQADVGQMWPLTISAIGLAMLITFVFERTHDRGLLLPGLILILSGGMALLFTMGMLSGEILTGIALYWPVLFLLVALIVLPRALGGRTE